MPKGIYKHKLASPETRIKMSNAQKRRGHTISRENQLKMAKSRFGLRNSWKGGIKVVDGGYRYVWQDGGYVREHHLAVEKHIGRPLREEEVVHHINFDKHDNRVENLYLFRKTGCHSRYHKFLLRNNLKGDNNGLTSNLFIYV